MDFQEVSYDFIIVPLFTASLFIKINHKPRSLNRVCLGIDSLWYGVAGHSPCWFITMQLQLDVQVGQISIKGQDLGRSKIAYSSGSVARKFFLCQAR